MTPSARRLLLHLVALLGLVVPVLGLQAANAVGTGVPVIVTPVDGEIYHVQDVPDLHLDFSDAPYGEYRFELTGTPGVVLLGGDVEHTEATDPDAFYEVPDLGPDEYTVTVFGAADAVLATATFGTFELGEPPVECAVNLPSKVVAVAPVTAVWPTFDNCGGIDSVTWFFFAGLDRTYGRVSIENGVSQGAWRFRDSYPTGRYLVQGSDAVEPFAPAQNTTSTVVKFGSRISLEAGTRTGTRVPLAGVASRYSPAANAFRRWADRPVAISYKDCAACPWKFLAMDRTNVYGAFGLTAISSKARYYRATAGETSTAWGRTSVPVRR